MHDACNHVMHALYYHIYYRYLIILVNLHTLKLCILVYNTDLNILNVFIKILCILYLSTFIFLNFYKNNL